MLGVVYVVLCMSIQYLMSRARPWAGIVSTPYETHVGSLVTSLYNRITMTLSYYPDSCSIKEYQFRILRNHQLDMPGVILTS